MRDPLLGEEVARCDRSPDDVADFTVAALTEFVADGRRQTPLTQSYASGSNYP